MAVYVVAIVEPPIGELTVGDRFYSGIAVASLCAVVERRAVAPAADDGELRHQFRVVTALAANADAILPFRFGAQMSRAELTRLLAQYRDALHDAMREVRGRKGQCALCGATPQMRAVLQNMSLFRLWPYFETRDEAVGSVAQPAA